MTGVALTPDGRIAISSSLDGSLRTWDVESGTSLRTLKGHTKGVLSVAACPDGKAALSGSADGTVRLWDLQTGKQLRIFHALTAESLAISPDGRFASLAHGYDVVTIDLLGPETPLAPPVVHAEDPEDQYREFAAFYKSVGLRLIRKGPGMGDLELAG